LLEVEGRDVRPPAEVYSFFQNTAGKQIKIKVGPNTDGKDARDVTVVPLRANSRCATALGKKITAGRWTS